MPEEYAPHLAGHLSGCDICQDACPYNADVAASPHTVGPAPERWRAITLIDIMSCDETERRIFVSGSLLARISPETLKRNAILAGARILKVALRKRFDDDLRPYRQPSPFRGSARTRSGDYETCRLARRRNPGSSFVCVEFLQNIRVTKSVPLRQSPIGFIPTIARPIMSLACSVVNAISEPACASRTSLSIG